MYRTTLDVEKTASDYCILNGRPDARLSDVERLTVLGGAGLDRVLGRLSKNLSSVTLESLTPDLNVAQLLAQGERLESLRHAGIIRELFSPPAPFSSLTSFPIHGFPEGAVFDLAFPSPFPSVNMLKEALLLDPGYTAIVENRTSYVRLWEHSEPSPSRITIVAIHGWTMGDQRVNSIAFLPGLFFSLGFDVAVVELPLHGRRRATTTGAGTEIFPSADPLRTLVGMAHAIRDLRNLQIILRGRGHSRFACLGMSLGAYIGQLWGALDPLDRLISIVPLVSMGDLAWELLKQRAAERNISRIGVTRRTLRSIFVDHCALEFEPKTSEEKMLVLSGRGDQLVSRSQIALLRDRLPHATFEWISGGHGAHVRSGGSFARIVDFLHS